MRDTAVILDEMLAAIDAMREAVANKSFDEFAASTLARLAVERAIEIVSEAARHLPKELLARHPHIPWPKIKAIGNVLRHEYHRIAPKIIWDVVTSEIGALEAVLKAERSLI
jgi:uncharacterized protein with HEPN domain